MGYFGTVFKSYVSLYNVSCFLDFFYISDFFNIQSGKKNKPQDTISLYLLPEKSK